MKYRVPKLLFLLSFLIWLGITFTCKKLEKSMLVSTGEVTNIFTNTADAAGLVVDLGGGATQHGHCYATTPNPTIAGLKTQLGVPAGTGGFTSQLTNLVASTKYCIKAYLSNATETVYGKETNFTTAPASVPTLTTTAIGSITFTTASSGGNITSDGGASVTAHGVCWNTATAPTTSNSKTSDGTGTGSYSSSLTGLTAGTIYYLRAYATNSAGPAYGNELTFTTTAIVLPTITTTAISVVMTTTATSGGNITSDGGASVTARGVCWSTTTGPTTANSKTSDASGTGSFVSSLTGLTPGTTYFVRGYATNSVGTSYGNEITFATSPIVPTLSTTVPGSITQNTASSGGNITSDGGASVTARGVCWSTSSGPTTSSYKTTDGTGSGIFSSSLTGLAASTKYYVRAYATNSAGTAYGNEVSFTTSSVILVVPTLTTTTISSITATTATSGGNITSDGGATVSVCGVCWNTTTSPTTANNKTYSYTGTGSFVSNLTSLTGNTTYYVRAYATNSVGTAYGNELSFTTSTVAPTLTTIAITSVGPTTATGGGDISSDGGASVTERGVCWSTTFNPTITDNKTSDGSGIGSFVSNLTGLTTNTTYYVRAYATNSAGTAYGNQVFFTPTVSVPTLTTTAISAIASTSATGGGNISNDGGASITTRGVCWSTYSSPTAANNHTTDGNGTGSFVSSLTGLIVGTTYYVRAYATNSAGTGYGNELSFTTSAAVVPTLSTTAITTITITTAASGGNVTDDGGANVNARGVCWNTSPNPTTANSKTSNGSGTGSFTSSITGLTGNTTYYIRAYATNSAGTAYGNELSFKTSAVISTLITTAVTSFTASTAISGGNITDDGGAIITARGVCWNNATSPTTANSKTSDGTGTGSFISNLTGLSSNTTYYVRAYSINSAGTAYGNEVSFTTSAGVPALSTAAITSVASISAVSGGNISNDGGASVTARGICWSTTNGPTTANNKTSDGSGTGSFTSSLGGLTVSTTYYVRAYATNSIGTGYGDELSFTTRATVTDIDGNVYNTVTIGTQAWMMENLKVKHYRNGDIIPNVTDGSTWRNLTTGAYVWYNNNEVINKNLYGALYNYFTTIDGRCLCPTSWHVPSGSEWTTLINFLGGYRGTIGGKMKEAGTTHWADPNTGATNESGFTALPGGDCYYSDVTFTDIGQKGYWWSSTVDYGSSSIHNYLSYNSTWLDGGYGLDQHYGFSVRCLQGNGQVLPAVTTIAASSIASITAVSGGNVTSDGGTAVTARGVCWSTSQNPTTANSLTNDGSGTGSFISNLTGLTANTTYYVRAYAINSVGTAYGNQVTFTTSSLIPALTTSAISSIMATTASSGGNITSDGGVTITARGVCWNTATSPTTANTKTSDGTGSGSFVSNLTGLTANTTYYVRAYAINSAGTAYGNEVSFTSGIGVPALTTSAITSVASISAISGGNISNDGGTSVIARGICWNTAHDPTITDNFTTNGSGTGAFISSLSGLTASTIYFVRAYATNSIGTGYGNELSFTTRATVMDIDLNIYNTINIGAQVWMMENLKTTKYNDGTSIPNVTDNAAWGALTTDAYCWYNNNSSLYKNTYGAIYNWYAVHTEKLCPTGWHVPTDPEWSDLENYLTNNGYNYDGTTTDNKIAKSLAGISNWVLSTVEGAAGNTDYQVYRNKSGFTAYPGGMRDNIGIFDFLNYDANWWSSTASDPDNSWNRTINNNYIFILRYNHYKVNGLSVRCLKD